VAQTDVTRTVMLYADWRSTPVWSAADGQALGRDQNQSRVPTPITFEVVYSVC
jgi:hypothetical protein